MSLSLMAVFAGVSSLILGVGLLAAWLLRERLTPAAQNRLLRATLAATVMGLVLSVVPLPRPTPPIFSVPEAPAPISRLTSETRRPHDAAPPAPFSEAGTQASPMPLLFSLWPALWSGVSLLLFLRLLLAYAAVVRLSHRALPYMSETFPKGIATATEAKKSLRLLSRPELDALFLADLPLMRPFLLLPADAEARFTPETFRAIVAHEMAHWERRDCRWNLAAQTLCCLLWFQPLAWLIWRQLERTAEMASDAAALAQTSCSPRAYANTLLHFAAGQNRADNRSYAGFGSVTAPLVRSSLKERLETLMKLPSSSLLPDAAPLRSGIAVVAALLALGGATLFGVRAASPVNAQPPATAATSLATDPLARIVTIEVADTSVIDTVRIALADTGLRVIPAEWEQNGLSGMIRSLKISDQPVPNALRLILRASGVRQKPNTKYNFRVEGDTVHIIPVQVNDAGIPLTKVTVKFGPGPTRTGLRTLLDAAGEASDIGDDLTGSMEFNFNGVPLAEALNTTLRQLPAKTVVSDTQDGVRIISRAQYDREEKENAKYSQMAEARSQEEFRKTMAQPVTMDVRNAGVQETLIQLFKYGKINNYLIDPSVSQIMVTCRFTDLPLQTALEKILAASKTPLQYRVENNVIIVNPKP